MTEFLTLEPQRGRKQKRRRSARAMEKQMRARIGRRPGRRKTIEQSSKGYFDDINAPVGRQACRVYFQNVQTLKIGEGREETASGLRILEGLGADVVGLSEVNKNWAHPMVREEYNRMLRREMPGVKLVVADNENYRPQGIAKPGGIMKLVARRVRERMVEGQGDKQGRWAKVGLKFEDTVMSVYTVYVPSGADLGGPTTIRRQLQHSMDVEDEGRQPGEERTTNLRERLYEDLIGEIERDMSDGREVVLGGILMRYTKDDPR